MEKKYKNVEELPEGSFIAKVNPSDKWNKDLNQGRGGFEKGVQQTIISKKTGQIGYKYNIESIIESGRESPLRYDNGEGKEYRYSIIAWDDKTKALADSGMVEIRIAPKLNQDKEEIFIQNKETKEFEKQMKYYINPVKEENSLPIDDQNRPELKKFIPKEPDEIDEDDIPIINEDEEISPNEIPF